MTLSQSNTNAARCAERAGNVQKRSLSRAALNADQIISESKARARLQVTRTQFLELETSPYFPGPWTRFEGKRYWRRSDLDRFSADYGIAIQPELFEVDHG